MTERGWVLTCDPGVDDAVALAVAASRADCVVTAIVAGTGNVDAPTAWRNAAGLAALLGLDVPVAIGSPFALDGTPIDRDGTTHGVDGLAGLSPLLAGPPSHPADGLPLVRGAVVATGPLTDLARARRSGQPLGPVVWMGGVLTGSGGGTGPTTVPAGDSTTDGEFNAGADPEAVDEVIAAVDDLTVVPRGVTEQVALTAADADRWASGTAIARFCAALARFRLRDGVVTSHDPVAVVAALEPDLFVWEHRHIRCSTGGDQPRGSLVPAAGRECTSGVRIAVGVDAAAVRDRIVRAVIGD